MIDFAHPVLLNKETKKSNVQKYQTAISNMSKGIISLRYNLNQFINLYLK